MYCARIHQDSLMNRRSKEQHLIHLFIRALHIHNLSPKSTNNIKLILQIFVAFLDF